MNVERNRVALPLLEVDGVRISELIARVVVLEGSGPVALEARVEALEARAEAFVLAEAPVAQGKNGDVAIDTVGLGVYAKAAGVWALVGLLAEEA